jgi:hypothetical protein
VNDGQKIGNLKGCNIGAGVNREGMAVMGGEGKKGSKIPVGVSAEGA